MNDAFTGDFFSTLVAPNIAAPAHQHFFSFRIDFDVDVTANRVVEETTRGEESTLNNRFDTVETVLATEGFRDANLASSRHWVVESTTTTATASSGGRRGSRTVRVSRTSRSCRAS